MRVSDQPTYILHPRPYRETSLLLECLTHDYGRVALIARGVRGAKPRLVRALLQPLQPLSLAWSGRGELATLVNAEASAAAVRLTGDNLLCALYLNELVLRITTRHDSSPALFTDYAITLQRLAHDEHPAWTLRRFERDLLIHLGYGLLLETDANTGDPIDPETFYTYHLEQGPMLWQATSQGLRIRGSALLALAQDQLPEREDLLSLRRLMRAVIANYVTNGTLQSWNLSW